jgi:hypothetical protein
MAEESKGPMAAVLVAASMVVERLTEEEALALHMAVLLEQDGRVLAFKDKVQQLYTQDGGRFMHEATRQAVLEALAERMAGPPREGTR